MTIGSKQPFNTSPITIRMNRSAIDGERKNSKRNDNARSIAAAGHTSLCVCVYVYVSVCVCVCVYPTAPIYKCTRIVYGNAKFLP